MNDYFHGISLVMGVNAALTVLSYGLSRLKDKIPGHWDDRLLTAVNIAKDITDILSGSWRRGF